ncbi:MAG: glycosyltransferase family 39 protein [Saprospiraceae bacterium]
MSTSNITSSKIDAKKFFILALIGIIIISLFRFRLIGIPLERDEGEFAYMGKLLLEGFLPYEHAYNMKLPGTNLMYAGLMAIFGTSFKGIHLGLIFINALTMLLLYYGIKKLFNPQVAVMAAWIYGLMAMSERFLGFAAHATHFIAFWVSLGILWYAVFRERRQWFWALLSGFAFGMGFLMKQHAIFWLVFGGLLFLFEAIKKDNTSSVTQKLAELASFVFGGILPYMVLFLVMYNSSVFDRFWFWTVEYAQSYTTTVMSWSDAQTLFWGSFKGMWKSFPLVWILLFGAIISVWKLQLTLAQKIFLYLAVVFGFLTVVPGFYFRQHYFISFLPAVAIMVGVVIYYGLSHLWPKRVNLISAVCIAIITFWAWSGSSNYYFSKTTKQLTSQFYGGNPFAESVEIGKYLKKHTNASDKIAVLGSEPELYLYSNRMSATGHLYMYGLMEPHPKNVEMQQEVIQEISKNNPEYIVYVNMQFSWLRRPDSPTQLMDWAQDYISKYYTMVGIADVVREGTKYYWDKDVIGKQPEGEQHIIVFKRNH